MSNDQSKTSNPKMAGMDGPKNVGLVLDDYGYLENKDTESNSKHNREKKDQR